MSIICKHYPQKRMCKEFHDVIHFLKEHGAKDFNKNWHWARWEWLLGHLGLDESTLPSIGLFFENETLIGVVTHDMRQQAYILLNPQYHYLKEMMTDYICKEFIQDHKIQIYADGNNVELTAVLKGKGFSLTERKEHVLQLPCSTKFEYALNEKFHITDFKTVKDIMKYVTVIHKGFENEGELQKRSESDLPERPNYNPEFALFISTPSGEYAAHCGIWYSDDTEHCYIEPVVTIPEYRKRGLGKAVVYEAVNRCVAMGAKKALVISNQKFYHNIGFSEYGVLNLWEKNASK